MNKKRPPIFVAGTDTGVGKTLVAGAFVSALVSKGLKVGVMKPVSCGGTADCDFLLKCAGLKESLELVNPIALKFPLSPNVASRLEKKKIDVGLIREAFGKLKAKHDILVIEGCGGLLVPITRNFFVIDLIAMLGAECVLVSRAGLGTINHSLLSLEALKNRGIKPVGVIFNRTRTGKKDIAETTSPEVVESLSGVPSLGVFPYLKTRQTRALGRVFLKHIDLKKFLC